MGKPTYRGKGKGTGKMWKVKEDPADSIPLEATMSLDISTFIEEHGLLKENVLRLEKDNKDMNERLLMQEQVTASAKLENKQLNEQLVGLADRVEAMQNYLDADDSVSRQPVNEERYKEERAKRLVELEVIEALLGISPPKGSEKNGDTTEELKAAVVEVKSESHGLHRDEAKGFADAPTKLDSSQGSASWRDHRALDSPGTDETNCPSPEVRQVQ